MAKISALPLAGPLAGDEMMPILQAGGTKRLDVQAHLQPYFDLVENAVATAQGLLNLRATFAEAIADFDIGTYFCCIEEGELRTYRRIALAPGYEDLGDDAAPVTRGLLGFPGPGRGADLIPFWQDDINAAIISMLDDARETRKLPHYQGATDTERLLNGMAANPNRRLLVPYRAAPYVIEGDDPILIGLRQTLYCEEGVRFEHVGNGAAFELGQEAHIKNMRMTADGAANPASIGVVVNGLNGKNGLKDCTIIGTGGPCLDFAALTAGSGFLGLNLELQRHNSPTGSGRPAIRIVDGEQLTAVPRYFLALRTNGQSTINMGGSNDTFITGAFISDVELSNNSRGVHLDGLRLANQALLVLRGHGIRVSGGIAATIEIAPGTDNVNMMGAYLNNAVIDNSGNGRNLYCTLPTNYPPVIRADLTAKAMSVTDGNWSRIGRSYEMVVFTTGTLTHGVDFTSNFFYLDLPARPDATNRYEGGLWMTYELAAVTKTIPVQLRLIGSSQVDVGGGVMRWRAQIYDHEGNAVAGAWLGSGWKLKGLRGTLRFTA